MNKKQKQGVLLKFLLIAISRGVFEFQEIGVHVI